MRRYLQLVIVLIIFFSAVFLRHITETERRAFPGASLAGDGEPRVSPTPTSTPQPTPTLPPAATATPTETAQPAPPATVVTAVPVAATSAVKTWPTFFVDSVFNDGAFTGKPARTTYGNLQVQVVMHSGRIEDILCVEYPLSNATSERMSNEFIPQLKLQALALQDWDVDVVSGATQTSQAFQRAMVYALRVAEQH